MKWMTRKGQKGFTLIELMIVVAIIGILAVLAIYGVSRYMKTAKTAEANLNVGQMSKNASEAFTRQNMSGAFVAPGGSTGISQCLCGTATLTVPQGIASVQAKKYTSDPAEWQNGDAVTGWKCLKFSIDQPQYYMYQYTSTAGTANGVCTSVGTNFHAIAAGDLDNNNVQSKFDLEGDIVSGNLVMAPKALETNPEE